MGIRSKVVSLERRLIQNVCQHVLEDSSKPFLKESCHLKSFA